MYISSWICPESSSADWSLRRYCGPHIICGSNPAVKERFCVWPNSRGVSVPLANYSAQRRGCDSYPHSCLWRGTKLFEQSFSAYLHVIYVHTVEAMHFNAQYFTRRIETRLFDREKMFLTFRRIKASLGIWISVLGKLEISQMNALLKKETVGRTTMWENIEIYFFIGLEV